MENMMENKWVTKNYKYNWHTMRSYYSLENAHTAKQLNSIQIYLKI